MQIRNTDVYKEDGMFAGWPANNGIWSFGEEIVVGFTQGTLEKKNVEGHKIDFEKPSYNRQSRSLDGGLTWSFEAPPEIASLKRETIRDFNGELDFLDPETAIRFVPMGVHAGSISPFFYSKDRCRSWVGPFTTPSMGLTGISARTEILPLSNSEALLFFACPKSDGYEGRAACAKISEGGGKFEFLSYIGPEPPGFTIMPASYRRKDGDIIAVLREEDRFDNPNRGARLTQYISGDLGKTWEFDKYIAEFKHSTPPAMKMSVDGILYLAYGYRDEPCGVRFRYSGDEGRTWSKDFILRDDGGNFDLGYTRITAMPDGSMLTAYYYNNHKNGGRYIASTRFKIY